MELINLRLLGEPLSIGIEAEGQVWDLHNAFDFGGFSYDVDTRAVRLAWRTNGYGPQPPAGAFEIVSEGVEYFEVTPRDHEIPDFGEDMCLGGLSRVSADDQTHELVEHGVRVPPDLRDGHFHLWFNFRGGQHIRIGAESARFSTLRE